MTKLEQRVDIRFSDLEKRISKLSNSALEPRPQIEIHERLTTSLTDRDLYEVVNVYDKDDRRS